MRCERLRATSWDMVKGTLRAVLRDVPYDSHWDWPVGKSLATLWATRSKRLMEARQERLRTMPWKRMKTTLKATLKMSPYGYLWDWSMVTILVTDGLRAVRG